MIGAIGTSPLYAFKESLGAAGFQPGDSATVLGLLSLIFWSLAIVVSVKYLAVIMRADNHGEGGILSLVAFVQQRFGTAEPWARWRSCMPHSSATAIASPFYALAPQGWLPVPRGADQCAGK